MITFSNGIITSDDSKLQGVELLKEVRDLVYSRKLPLFKPIAFKIVDPTVTSSTVSDNFLMRKSSVLEGPLQLTGIFKDIILYPTKINKTTMNSIFRADRKVESSSIGAITSDEKFYSMDPPAEFKCLNKEMVLYNTLDPEGTVSLMIIRSTGKMDVEEAYHETQNHEEFQDYFPLQVDFCLGDLIKFLPNTLETGKVEYRLFGNLTDTMMNEILEDYYKCR